MDRENAISSLISRRLITELTSLFIIDVAELNGIDDDAFTSDCAYIHRCLTIAAAMGRYSLAHWRYSY